MRNGSRGDAVRDLQRRLARLGFDPGAADGIFGGKTTSAVQAFQRAMGLVVDGVAGPATLGALRGRDDADFPIERAATMFSDAPARNVEVHLPMVLSAMRDAGLGDEDLLLMALATIRAETAAFTPVSEYRSRYNTSSGGHPFDRYDDRADLGNRGRPDGERYRGRGFIQLTGRANYARIGEALGVGTALVDDPDRANEPRTAARILACFLADKEAAIRDALAGGDLASARRLVNGGSHGLDRFTAAFEAGRRFTGA